MVALDTSSVFLQSPYTVLPVLPLNSFIDSVKAAFKVNDGLNVTFSFIGTKISLGLAGSNFSVIVR
jgi:hypothetical protein